MSAIVSSTRSFFDRKFFGSAGTREFQLDSLDGVRGLAVLWVMLAHARAHGWLLHPSVHFGSGEVGVFLFFCLSAFLLTLPICDSPAAELRRPGHWANYAVRRFLRIYPLFIAVLIVFFVVQPLAEQRPLRENLVLFWQHLTLRGGYRHLWTIAVETKFYFILPLLGLGLQLLRGRAWTQAAATAALIALASYFFPAAESPNDTLVTGYYLPVFLCGCLAAALLSDWRRHRPACLTPGRCEAAALVALAIVLPLADSGWGWLPDFDSSRAFVLWGIVWAVFVLSHLLGTGLCRRVFAWKPLRFLGIVSYSAYIWHPVILSSMKPLKSWLPGPLGVVTFYVVTLAVASVSYLIIERPLARIRLSFGRRVPAAPVGA